MSGRCPRCGTELVSRPKSASYNAFCVRCNIYYEAHPMPRVSYADLLWSWRVKA